MSVAARLGLLALLLCLTACSGAAPGQAVTPTALAAAEQGRLLFRNKGCVTCHQNDRVGGESGLLAVGPNLTNYSNDPAFLRQWLADPQAVKPNTPMPTFGLTAAEIEDLIAFLNQAR